MNSKIFSFFIAVCLLTTMILPKHNVNAIYPYPPEANQYLQLGESIQALHPVTINGRQYTIVYYQTKTNSDTEGDILYDKLIGRWSNMGVTGLLVFDGICPVSDAGILRQVLLTETSGYMLTQVPKVPTMITVDPDMEDDMRKLTNNPLYWTAFVFQNISRLFKSPAEEYVETFRNMLVPQGQDRQQLEAFAEDAQNLIENGESIKDAIEKTQSLAKYSNDRSIREFAKGADKYFANWDIVTQSKTVKIDGVDVEYFNALKIFSLAFMLYGMQDLSLERAEMLDRLVQASEKGDVDIDPTIRSAMDVVVAEAEDGKKQTLDMVAQFVRDNAVDVAVSATKQVLVKNWTSWAFKTYGTRTTGHLVAGVASQILLGFSISNLLFGMDAIYANSATGVRAAELEKSFEGIANSIKNKYLAQAYDYHYADIYRTGVFYKNVAAAQAYRSYAERVASSRLIKIFADLFTGNEWDKAQKYLEQYGNESEYDIENLIGHPKILDFAVDQVFQRRAMKSQSSTTSSSTFLVFDVSASMSEADATGITKLDAAKSAGERILDIVDSENNATCSSSANLGVVSFSNSATVNIGLVNDTQSIRQSLASLYAGGGTGMPDGVRLAIDQFPTNQGAKPIMIMLSDGMPNIGLGGNGFIDKDQVRQQVLDLATEAGKKSICIYTVGFGVPNTTGSVSGEASIDEDFLKKVSANSGCGSYYNAQNATDLANVYVGLRHESTGKVLLKKTGEIAQGQTVDIGAVPVPQGQNELLVTLNWPGSRLDPALVDPSGKQVDKNYPGATFFQSKSLASVIVQNPAAGNWKLSAFGADVPKGKTVFNAVASTRFTGAVPPTPPPGPGSPLALVIIILGVGGLLVYTVVVTTRRGRQSAVAGGNASMIVLSGQSSGRSFSVSDNYLIGRGQECQMRLSERAISRQHARIRYAEGRWYIQDLKSAGGTYLNGVKVSAAPLNPGDRIRIGSSEFEFKG